MNPSKRNNRKNIPQMIKHILAIKPNISIEKSAPNPAIIKAINRKTPAMYKKLFAESKSLGSASLVRFFKDEYLT